MTIEIIQEIETGLGKVKQFVTGELSHLREETLALVHELEAKVGLVKEAATAEATGKTEPVIGSTELAVPQTDAQ